MAETLAREQQIKVELTRYKYLSLYINSHFVYTLRNPEMKYTDIALHLSF